MFYSLYDCWDWFVIKKESVIKIMMQKTSPLDLSFSSRRISVTIEVAALANFANFLRQQLRLLYLSIIFTLGATGMFALSRQPKRIYQVTYRKSCGRNESSDDLNHIVFDVYLSILCLLVSLFWKTTYVVFGAEC